jgi:hypothetical protein
VWQWFFVCRNDTGCSYFTFVFKLMQVWAWAWVDCIARSLSQTFVGWERLPNKLQEASNL